MAGFGVRAFDGTGAGFRRAGLGKWSLDGAGFSSLLCLQDTIDSMLSAIQSNKLLV
jgi:hypothetical protein